MTEAQYPVLVYGTLRPTCHNYNYILQGHTISEQDISLEGFTMYGRTGFPYITRGENTITATLIYIKSDEYEATMQRLDSLEGYHGEDYGRNHYDRILHEFTLGGEKRKAWIYIAGRSMTADVQASLPVIEIGDWIEHVRERVVSW